MMRAVAQRPLVPDSHPQRTPPTFSNRPQCHWLSNHKRDRVLIEIQRYIGQVWLGFVAVLQCCYCYNSGI